MAKNRVPPLPEDFFRALGSIENIITELQSLFQRRVAEPVDMSNDPYFILGVQRSDSIEMVRAVYHAKVKILHPDATGGGDVERFKEIDTAYKAICAEKGG